MPYSQLLSAAWGYIEGFRGSELVRSHIRNIRHKFIAAGLPGGVIQTTRGKGARISLSSPDPPAA